MNTDATVEPDQLTADAIDGAEEMPDPLAGLAEKTAADPGAPFMPEALEALAALRQNNRAAFEALRSQLKKAGCRVTALDDAIAEENGTPGPQRPAAVRRARTARKTSSSEFSAIELHLGGWRSGRHFPPTV